VACGRIGSRGRLALQGGFDTVIDSLVVGDARGQIVAGKYPVA